VSTSTNDHPGFVVYTNQAASAPADIATPYGTVITAGE
jgi:hypothetical protein